MVSVLLYILIGAGACVEMKVDGERERGGKFIVVVVILTCCWFFYFMLLFIHIYFTHCAQFVLKHSGWVGFFLYTRERVF